MKNADFSERLIEAMKIRRMSAADLSRLTGIDKSAISRYRSGAYKPNQINTYILAQPFVSYSNPTLLWAGSICLYVPL